jgi:hypothetical protein
MWTLAFGYHEDRAPTHAYEPTREAAMAVRQELAAREVTRPLARDGRSPLVKCPAA